MALTKLFLALTASAILGARLARADDLDTLYQRSLPNAVLSAATSASEVQNNLQTLRANGTWAVVDYTTGCNARRSNWPASGHWSRILDMAAAYHGGVEGADQYVGNPDVRAAIGRAMEFWFANDFSTIGNGACMDGGGKADDLCPCGTPGLWNTNWYSNVILIPGLVGPTCLLLRDELTPTEYGNCTFITARSYTPFYRNPQPGYVSGANIIDMAVIGIAAGLLENNRTGNMSQVADAYERVHDEVVIHPEDLVDGIKPDGSFQQHLGIIYDGKSRQSRNYGKDFSNSLLKLEIQAVGTQFQANKTIQDTFGWHLQGAQWMTFANTITKIIHWDFSVIGRMITWPVVDMQASANLKMDLNQVSSLGNSWNQADIIRFGKDLADSNPSTANAGHLKGNRMFWNSDYMVHRTSKTVTTLKMLSNRTATSECVNVQNTRGFHLSDGAVYTYTTGAEYEDMYATVDFSLIPGTTTDYGNTPLNCETTLQYGVDTYAGGVSAGDVGVAAMRYVNPLTKALSFHKAWFFFPDNVQHVLISSINSTSAAPVFSVLDQRLHAGDIYLDGERVASGNYCDVESLWHSGTGYVFPADQDTEISVDAEVKTGKWSEIGTSTQPLSQKDMFTSWIVHDSSDIVAPIEYSVFPATESHDAFEAKAESCTPYTVANDGTVSAAVDSTKRLLGAAFWAPGGGSLFVPQMGLTIYVDKSVVLTFKLTGNGSSKGELSVADPTHENSEVNVRLVWVSKGHRRGDSAIGHHQRAGRGYGHQPEVSVHIELPTGGMAGSTVMQKVKRGQ